MGGVVIVGPNDPGHLNHDLSPQNSRIRPGSLACVEVLGRTVLGRTREQLVGARLDSVAVMADASLASSVIDDKPIGFFVAQELWPKALEQIAAFKQQGAEAVFVICLGSYVEFEPAEMLQFHRDEGKRATRAFGSQHPLDVWVVDPGAFAEDADLWKVLREIDAASYYVRGYVNRLEDASDLRRLVCDGLGGRCQFRPAGFEVKPGIWFGQGAQVERGARVVAPAFVGRDSKIADQCLITRGSNVESNSQVDYGTVIEDSSVLSNTYVGIGLDLSHSIVDGGNLLNLRHGVVLKVSDPVVLRQMREGRARTGTDGSFFAHFDGMAVSSVPERQ